MKLASPQGRPRTWWLFVATVLASSIAFALAAASGCVGDDPATGNGGGGDSSADGTSTGDGGVDAPVSDSPAGDAADAACKMCNGQCVSVTDPLYGCSPTSCTPCAVIAHTKAQKCIGESCAVDTCDVGFDDLDTDAGDGCEAQNPRSFQPAKLALWLTANAGVQVSADGGVTAWANQAGVDGGTTGATAIDGHATLDKTLWPNFTGAPSIMFQGSDRFGVDLKAIENTQFTLFIVAARYGDNGYNCLLGSPTYPPGSPGCPAQKGIAFNICYGPANTTFYNEIYCNSLTLAAPANTSSGYQPALLFSSWDGSLNRASINGSTVDDTGQFPGPLLSLTGTSWLGCAAGGGLCFKGLLAEVVAYSTLLSAPDQAAVRAYLKTKWKLP